MSVFSDTHRLFAPLHNLYLGKKNKCLISIHLHLIINCVVKKSYGIDPEPTYNAIQTDTLNLTPKSLAGNVKILFTFLTSIS